MSDRVAIVRISPAMWSVLLGSRKMMSVDSDWPPDAMVVNAEFDFNTREVRLMVRSAIFDEVPEGAIPPFWAPQFTGHTTLASALVYMMQAGQAEIEQEAAT